MLKIIHGEPNVHLFEVPNAVEIEQARRRQIYHGDRQGACIRGFQSDDRDSITLEIYAQFKSTNHYAQISDREQELFSEFLHKIYLGKLKHPRRKANFYYGDCLEPGFISRVLNRPELIPVIENTLKVQFPISRHHASASPTSAPKS